VQENGYEELHEWLLKVDPKGNLLQYETQLVEVCDGDLAQIASFKRQRRLDESILAAIDESFWTELKVTKTGHKLLLAKAIDELAQG